MRPLFGRALADSRRSWIGRSDWALAKEGSWTRTPEASARDHREEVSNTPAESLKPEKQARRRLRRSCNQSYSACRFAL